VYIYLKYLSHSHPARLLKAVPRSDFEDLPNHLLSVALTAAPKLTLSILPNHLLDKKLYNIYIYIYEHLNGAAFQKKGRKEEEEEEEMICYKNKFGIIKGKEKRNKKGRITKLKEHMKGDGHMKNARAFSCDHTI
jgi:hypothetical protein